MDGVELTFEDAVFENTLWIKSFVEYKFGGARGLRSMKSKLL